MRETWYVLEDGSLADPARVTADEAGRLVHSSGLAVEMKNGVPRSRGVDDADAERARAPKNTPATPVPPAPPAPPADGDDDEEDDAQSTTREMTAEKPKRPYKTRAPKAD